MLLQELMARRSAPFGHPAEDAGGILLWEVGTVTENERSCNGAVFVNDRPGSCRSRDVGFLGGKIHSHINQSYQRKMTIVRPSHPKHASGRGVRPERPTKYRRYRDFEAREIIGASVARMHPENSGTSLHSELLSRFLSTTLEVLRRRVECSEGMFRWSATEGVY